MIVFFNLIGVGMLLLGFGVPIAVQSELHVGSDNVLQVVAGVLLTAMDLAWRFGRKGEDVWQDVIVDSQRGGQLFFLPIWIWGTGWAALGVYRLSTAV